MTGIELGDVVKDKLTGFIGEAWACSTRLYGRTVWTVRRTAEDKTDERFEAVRLPRERIVRVESRNAAPPRPASPRFIPGDRLMDPTLGVACVVTGVTHCASGQWAYEIEPAKLLGDELPGKTCIVDAETGEHIGAYDFCEHDHPISQPG